MKLKSFSLITLAIGIFFLLVGVVSPFVALQNHTPANGAVGIIGGADAPTYQFFVMQVMNGGPFCLILLGIAFIVSALFCLLFSKTVKANCTVKTTVISMGLSAVGAIGIACFFIWVAISAFHETSKHPILYPISVSLGAVSFLVFMALCALYFRLRMDRWSFKGLVIDILTSVLYLPSFFFAFAYLYELVS